MSADPVDPGHRTDPLTSLLLDGTAGAGDRRAAAFAAIHEELRRIARSQMHRERADHTLQATALVNEAWLRLLGRGPAPEPGDRPAFLAAAANTMRRILIDHARARGRQKRGEGARVPLDALQLATAQDTDALLAVDEAIAALAVRDARLAEQARLRLWAGLDDTDIAAALGVSDRTVRRDWLVARAFLQRHLQPEQ